MATQPIAAKTFTSVSPTTGNNGTVLTIAGPAYTGRTAVTETYQVKTTSGSPQASVTLSATRQAAGLILTNATPAIISAAGGTDITLEGTSNAEKLYFFEESDDDFYYVTDVQISTDGGSTWTIYYNGNPIANDPGARAAYKWRVIANCSANATSSTRPITVTIGTVAHNTPTTAPGQRIVVNLTQAASLVTATFTPAIIPAAGGTGFALEGTANFPQLYLNASSEGVIYGIAYIILTSTIQISTDGGSTWIDYEQGTDIPGYQGATVAYKWRASAYCLENTRPTPWNITVSVGLLRYSAPTTAPGQRMLFYLMQEAPTYYMNVSTYKITIQSDGAAETFTVNGNTPFTVS
jgi:hypothetical protein